MKTILSCWDSESGMEAQKVALEICDLESRFGRGYLATYTRNGTAFIIFSTEWISREKAKEYVEEVYLKR